MVTWGKVVGCHWSACNTWTGASLLAIDKLKALPVADLTEHERDIIWKRINLE